MYCQSETKTAHLVRVVFEFIPTKAYKVIPTPDVLLVRQAGAGIPVVFLPPLPVYAAGQWKANNA